MLIIYNGVYIGKWKKNSIAPVFVKDVELKNLKYKAVPKPELPKELLESKILKPVQQFKVTIPIITADIDVKPEDIMKPIDELENVKNGASNIVGDKLGDDFIALPIQKGTLDGVVSPKKNDAEDEGIMYDVQITAQFPGGFDAWKRYLEKNLNASLPAENGAQSGKYTVMVSFVVDKEGNISEVKSENTPGFGTEAEAIRIIKKGSKWQPAIQNGRKVAYRVRQQVTFMVDDNE